MDNLGFYIKEIKVTGINKVPAEISFSKGYNLVSGLSDTGKSFVFSCINFMLGKTELSKDIPESKGYTDFYMQINTYEENSYTLYRKLNDSKIQYKECKIDEYNNSNISSTKINVKTGKSANDLSTFLLNLCGIQDVYLLKSQSNKVNLVYTYIRYLTVISEIQVITENSPFYPTQQGTDKPLFQSLIAYLLTGKDYKDYNTIEKEEIRKGKINGKIEFILNRIETITDKLQEYSSLPTESKDSEYTIEALKKKSQQITESITMLSEQKLRLLETLEDRKSKLIFYQELLERLNLLRKHYESDIERLFFLEEGRNLFSQLNNVGCPICDNPLEEVYLLKINGSTEIKESILTERNNLELKINDLNSTIQSHQKTINSLSANIEDVTQKYSELNLKIEQILTPQLDVIKKNIDEIKDIINIHSQMEYLNKDLQYYLNKKTEFESQLKDRPVGEKIYSEIDFSSFNDKLKSILSSWNYPDIDNLAFNSSSKKFDFLLSGKERGAFGKGMRGISYTAILITLVQYCIENKIPFTKLLVIDSPLTTYHGKEEKTEEDEIDPNIENAFFKEISNMDMDFQFIMLDNKTPSADVIKKINYQRFTKDKKNGRFGFFPIQD